MIYVIRAVQEFGENDFRYTIKVGYSGDWTKRKVQYESYFYKISVLYIYSGGTREDEAKILRYFKDKLVFKNEWFEYSDDIIEFFKVNDTIEKLRESLRDIVVVMYRKNRFYSLVDPILVNYILDHLGISDLIERTKKQKEIEQEVGIYSEINHINVACKLYGLDMVELTKHIKIKTENLNKNLSKTVENFATKFNEEIGFASQKLKALVEFSELPGVTENDMENLFQLIPAKYGDYYKTLGPARIRANGYHEFLLKQEFNNLRGNAEVFGSLSEEIYKIFELGKRYTKADIKKTLSDLYKKMGYNKTAKAIDISEYFIIKTILTKDKKAGYEIIAKK